LRVESPAIAGAVIVIAIEVLEAEGVRVIRYQFIVRGIVTQVQTGDLRSCERGTVAAVLELVVINVGDIPGLLVIIIGGIVGIVDGDEGRGILDVNQVIFVCAVVNGDVVAAVVLVVVEVVLGVIVLGEVIEIVLVFSIIVIPRFEIRAVGVIVIVGGIAVEEVGELDVGLIVVGVIRGVVDGVEGLIVAVNDFCGGGIAASVVVGYVAVFVLHAVGWRGIVFLWPISRKLSG
jgi:hypothetical protein